VPIANEMEQFHAGRSGLIARLSHVLLKGITLMKCDWSAALN
jgi:hypothetical protein